MDPLTHSLVTYKLVGKEPSTLAAGLAPDMAWYCTYPLWVIKNKQLKSALRTGIWPTPPLWMVMLHFVTHSIIVALVVVGMLRLVTGKRPKKLLSAWLLHIAIDIPTHSRDPWGPRFLWPLSDIAFNGVSWAEVATKALASKIQA